MDIRMPMGLMFSLVGLLLAVYGLITRADPMYQRSLGINVNFWWGLVLLAFGLIMWGLAYRRSSLTATPSNPGADEPAKPSPR